MTSKKHNASADLMGPQPTRNNHRLCIACALIAVLILAMDLSVPLGVAMGVPYIAVVLLSLWSPDKRFTIATAVVTSIFTTGAFWIKPEVGEMWKVVANRALALSAIWVTAWLGLQRKDVEAKREKALAEREKALEDVRILRGLLPICASCKKIRNDEGYWINLEQYISEHSEADFTHGICEDCARTLYPELFQRRKAPPAPPGDEA